jgi:hypothetical protein
MKKQNPFRRLRAKSPQPEEIPPAKSTSEMTDAELEESLRQARRELLEAQHDALRERERARVAPADGGRTKRRPLSEIFKNSNRRRFS